MKDLTQGPIFSHILRMSLPIFLGMTAQLLLNIIDGIYVGRLGIDASLAVLNYGFPIYYLFFAFFNGLSIGTNSTLARYIGAKKKEVAENALSQIFWISLSVFAVVVLVYPLAIPRYFLLMKAGVEAAKLTHDFLTMLFIGMPFLLVSLSLGGALRAEGNMRTLATAQMLAVLANVIVAPFLIYSDFGFWGLSFHGADLGVRGAGLATTFANILAALFIAWPFLRGKTHLRWIKKPTWSSLDGVKGIFQVGLPSSLSQIMIGIYIILMTWLAADFGKSAVAAIGIGGRLDLMAVFPSLAIMTSILTLVGQNYGAGKMDRVRKTLRIGSLTAFGSLAFISLLVYLFRMPLIRQFHQDPATQASALHYLSFQCLGYGFVGLNIAYNGAFQGLGRGFPFLLLTTLRLLALTLPTAYLLSQHFGEYGLHYAPVFANLATACIATPWILSAVKKLSVPIIPSPSASV